MNKPMSDSRSFEVLTANPVRLSSSPARSYRSWSDEEKARIVGQTLVAGANVSAIARSNGLDPSQLFAWRRKAIASGMVAPLGGSPSRPVKFVRFEAMRSDTVEIVIGDVVVRAGGDVEPDRLADMGNHCTLLQTAKMNDVDPLTWLAQTLQRIANGWPISQIEKLMPWNYKA